MKKLFLVLSILILSGTASSVAYAGSLNSYENEIVARAQGVFEKDGIKYKLASGYLDQLIGYLSSDEIDLTKEQRDKAFASIQDYIGSGVEGGYLVPISGQKSTEETAGNTGDDGSKDDKKADNSKSGSTSDEKKTADGSNTAEDKAVTNSGDTKAQSKADEKGLENNNSLVTGFINQILDPTTPDANQASDLTESGNIIKNTGFNLNRTVVMAIGMGLLMIICMIATCRLKFFAHNDE